MDNDILNDPTAPAVRAILRLGQRYILNIYVSVIRPVLEYACQVWHTNLPSYLSDNIERIQIRVMKGIYPGHNYDYILTTMTKLSKLHQRRDFICRNYVNKVTNVNHKLHRLLPARRIVHHDTRTTNIYPNPDVRTERYKR